MKPNAVALVARADKSRLRIAKALRDGGYDVFECEELSIASRFVGVVAIDDQDTGDAVRAQVQAWHKVSPRPRVVVISVKPTAWKALALAHGDCLVVLAAPAFSWEIVDALRAPPPGLPDRA
jgi:hypothetical protein